MSVDTLLISYRVRADRLDEHLALLDAVYRELDERCEQRSTAESTVLGSYGMGE